MYPILSPYVSTLDSILSPHISMFDLISSWFDLTLTTFPTPITPVSVLLAANLVSLKGVIPKPILTFKRI